MAISTILQCCIADEEMFKGEDRFGEGNLSALLDQSSTSTANMGGGGGFGGVKVAAIEGKPVDIQQP